MKHYAKTRLPHLAAPATLLVFVAFSIFIPQELYAQTQTAAAAAGTDAQLYNRRIVLPRIDNVYEYRIEIEMLVNNDYHNHLTQYIREPSIVLAFPEGHYRFNFTPYDILGRPGNQANWTFFTVTPPVAFAGADFNQGSGAETIDIVISGWEEPPAPVAAAPVQQEAAPDVPAPQREPRERTPRQLTTRPNRLTAEVMLLGGGARYERVINRNFSLGANAFVSRWSYEVDEEGYYDGNWWDRANFAENTSWEMTAAALLASRLLLGPVYVELGLGFGYMEWANRSNFGIMVSPGIGVRLGGNRTAFFANPFYKVAIMPGTGAGATLGVGLGYDW
jgi:hypothetical protein